MVKNVFSVMAVAVLGVAIVSFVEKQDSSRELTSVEYRDVYESLISVATKGNMNNTSELAKKIDEYSGSERKLSLSEYENIKQFALASTN